MIEIKYIIDKCIVISLTMAANEHIRCITRIQCTHYQRFKRISKNNQSDYCTI